MRGSSTAAFLLGTLLVSCAQEGHPAGARVGAITIAGPWNPPATTRQIASTQYVRVEGVPNVAPLGRCTSTNPFACSCTHPACHAPYAGTVELEAFLRRRYPQLRAGGLYCCRQNSATTAVPELSVHAVGRAMDLMVTRIGGDADNTAGDPVANWLVEHAEEIGIQRVIWDKAFWNGERGFGALGNNSLPHTDHLHVELSTAGAMRQTPFFMSGASTGGSSCAARCEGSRIVNSDCSSGDCAVFGTACIPGSPPRCGTPQCPPTGDATICLDSGHILSCRNGALTGPAGDCSAFAAFCSTAGVAPTAARCVFALCTGSPSVVPYDHTTCSVVGGKQYVCRADNTFSEVACPPGEACILEDGAARCAPASPSCPIQPPGAPVLDRIVCVDGTTIARCYNGNQVERRSCGRGTCRTVDGNAACAEAACLEGGAVVTRPVCVGGFLASCDADGTVGCVQACPDGTRCEPTPTGVSCVPGEPMPGDVEGLAQPAACGISFSTPDAGSPAPPDAAVVPAPDAGGAQALDASAAVRDAGARDASGSAGAPITGGCGCRAAESGPTPSWAALSAFAWLATRRRRR